MTVQIKIAETPQEREQAYRLRYEIYVGELDLPMEHADHEKRQIIDPLDEHGVLVVAAEDGDVVGSVRLNFADQPGGLGEYTRLYQLERFKPYFPSVSIATRFSVQRSHRSTTIPTHMVRRAFDRLLKRGTRIHVIDCQPHLNAFFERLGYRRTGLKIAHPDDPRLRHAVMALAVRDLDYLQRLRSPFRKLVSPAVQDAAAGPFLESFRARAQCA